MRLFLSAGEPSGDLHAANLIEALRRRFPDAEFVGFGGPRMEEAGAKLIYPLVELAVMWFGRVLINLHKFIALANRADRVFRDEKPDALILIDYPGFNFALAKRARRRGIPVIWFVPPQLWAWAGWRSKKMQKYVDLLLCSLPFEPAWYSNRGVEGAFYVGHPYFDELAHRALDESFLESQRQQDGPLIAILSGSRTQELRRNLPTMLRAAALVASRRPDARFAMACLHDRHRELATEMVRDSNFDLRTLEIHSARTPELIRLADAAWAVSGSVGLELMVEALPTVVLYRIKDWELEFARPFIKAKYISLVNLMADAEVMPEFLTSEDVSPEMARLALRWIEDSSERARVSGVLAQLRDRVAVPGATDRAAGKIAEFLGSGRTYRGPHERGDAGIRSNRVRGDEGSSPV